MSLPGLGAGTHTAHPTAVRSPRTPRHHEASHPTGTPRKTRHMWHMHSRRSTLEKEVQELRRRLKERRTYLKDGAGTPLAASAKLAGSPGSADTARADRPATGGLPKYLHVESLDLHCTRALPEKVLRPEPSSQKCLSLAEEIYEARLLLFELKARAGVPWRSGASLVPASLLWVSRIRVLQFRVYVRVPSLLRT